MRLLRILTVSTTVFFVLLAGVTLLRLSTAEMSSFDGQFAGYEFAQAKGYLASLSEKQRTFYLGPFRVADTVFPALLALTLALWWRYLSTGMLRTALMLVTALYLVADYAENMYVARLLIAGAENISRSAVETASLCTQVKWAALLICIGTSVIFWWSRGREV